MILRTLLRLSWNMLGLLAVNAASGSTLSMPGERLAPEPAASSSGYDAALLETLIAAALDRRLTDIEAKLQQRIDHVALQQEQRLFLFHSDVQQQLHPNAQLQDLEARLRDAYAEDMGGMELWMRQEYGHAIVELRQQREQALADLEARMRDQHAEDLARLRQELLVLVDVHAANVAALDGKVQEGISFCSRSTTGAVASNAEKGKDVPKEAKAGAPESGSVGSFLRSIKGAGSDHGLVEKTNEQSTIQSLLQQVESLRSSLHTLWESL